MWILGDNGGHVDCKIPLVKDRIGPSSFDRCRDGANFGVLDDTQAFSSCLFSVYFSA